MTANRFEAPFYLRNAHLQTLLNGKGPRAWRAQKILQRLRSQTLLLQAADGTRLLAELDRAAHNPRSALVVLLHGWEGCSRSAYLVTMADQLLARGYDVLRVNLRDHGDSHHLNRELLQGFVDTNSYSRFYIAGFSLGGSFALRIAADAGTELGLRACVAVCPPVDPAHAMDALNNGFFAYERYFFKQWQGSLRRKLQHFPDLDYAAELAQAKSLDDLNRLFIPRHTPYERIEDYFAAYALVGSRLAALAVPGYLIAALDDPIIPVEDVERIDPIDKLRIETYRNGGRCGFIETLAAHSWIEARILQLLEEHE